MCEGIAIFVNNKKALCGKGTSSHSEAVIKLKINEDDYRKYEYHFWDKRLVADKYDSTAEQILAHIDKKKAYMLAKRLVAKDFNTDTKIIKWLGRISNQYKYIRKIKSLRRRNIYLKTLFGLTEAEYKKTIVKRDVELQAFYKRIKEAPVLHPQEVLSKKEISLKVDLAFSLLNLPKVGIEFKYINNSKDYANANTNAYANAYAYAYANVYAYATTNAYANAYTYTYANAYANTNSYDNAHTKLYANANNYANANAYA